MNKLYIFLLLTIFSSIFAEVNITDLENSEVWKRSENGQVTIYREISQKRVPILCFHIIGDKERYEISALNFTNLMEYLNDHKFWLISDKEFIKGDLSSVPTGYRPIVMGSDDASEGNFLFQAKTGTLDTGVIDFTDPKVVENTMVDILQDNFTPRDGIIPFTFYVSFNGLPFRQTGGEIIDDSYLGSKTLSFKFQYVMDNFILGNHTFSHPITKLTTASDFKEELNKFYDVMYSYLGDDISRIDTLAYPHGCHDLTPEMRFMLENYNYRGVQLSGGFDFDGYFSTSPYGSTLDNLDISRLGVDNKNIDRVYGWLESVPLLVSRRVLVVDSRDDLIGFTLSTEDEIIIRGES